MYLEIGVLKEAPVSISVGSDIMELGHLKGAWGCFIKPYGMNVVTQQQSRKMKAGGGETSQGLVTPLAVEAKGEKGETPPGCDHQPATEETGDLEVGLRDSPEEKPGQLVVEETETLRQKLENTPPGEGALLTGAPELPMDCLPGQEELKQEALVDPSLEELRQMAQEFTPDKREQMVWDKGLLYRLWEPRNHAKSWEPCYQLVVPLTFRKKLLSMARDLSCTGYMGRDQTFQRLQANFYWPRLAQNVMDYRSSCETCERTGKRGDKRKPPLQPLPIIDQAFQRVRIDVVGPLRHKTCRGKQYILTFVYFKTRYLEAVALASTEAPVVADTLTKIFFQLGFPSEILTDRGGNFLAEVMKCLWECCGVQDHCLSLSDKWASKEVQWDLERYTEGLCGL
ncbi:hypothetical protein Y1Q_0016986 [Alligator mississippiensis]|uniref:Gypsy retrotransposon integrase-like protein 1 n=1 Tax=Alligator mississippiensis TaxID=8496 RepID=A0A151N377_ALLMI|nr:hypothetical protein Y1Q_0016986 [Alligator mississippiensis]